MSNSFQCTQCGKCCVGLHIPLSIQESILWISRGHHVKILVEAIPWIPNQTLSDDTLKRKEKITFSAISGTLPIRVQVTLVGYFMEACPNLDSHNRCGIYDQRPMTCRVYPFELNPSIALNPSNKLCPTEAWDLSRSVPNVQSKTSLQISIIDTQTQNVIDAIHQTNINEVKLKEYLCVALGIQTCSLSNDGYLFHIVAQQKLLESLESLTKLNDTQRHSRSEPIPSWLILSKSEETRQNLSEIGAFCYSNSDVDSEKEYIHFS